jgi:hypothetical protein
MADSLIVAMSDTKQQLLKKDFRCAFPCAAIEFNPIK